MSRPKPLSGFPEFLPEQALVEQRVIDIVRDTYELHGFARIETRAVETIEELSRKGEITKEVYTVKRLHADPHDAADLGLHFDLTVPFARYVLENSGHLNFPFRRYQIQKVWRGERPQEGRYREFLQADIDVIGENELAQHHDLEVILVLLATFERLHREVGIAPCLMRVNNRKLAMGFYAALGIEDTMKIVQTVDKIDKIGEAGVRAELAKLDATDHQIDQILAMALIRTDDPQQLRTQVAALGLDHEQLAQGLDELCDVIATAAEQFPGRVIADLRISRGLDYYTGTVMETELIGMESLGAICAGGRYDALATDGKRTYPGVGISLGLTRILAPLLTKNKLHATRSVPSAVLVAVTDDDNRSQANGVAAALRARGIACEVAPKASKFGKQIAYADKRGIPYVWFDGISGSVKDIRTGQQDEADAHQWTPAAADLHAQVVTAH
ncbi:MAG: histidine--tRNA ligase [Propionibacteriaceae bacterium]